MYDFVEKNTIFMTLAGSHLYGTNVATSDIDKRGVCIPPFKLKNGFYGKFDEYHVPGEDTIVYALDKFMSLASKCNPNIIELLFSPPEVTIITSPLWEKIRERRHEFLSANAFNSFTGYAFNQLDHMKTHRGWRMDPPTHKPTREEFGLSKEATGIKELSKGVDVTTIDPQMLVIINQEKAYKQAAARWDQFLKWQKERNPTRYDTEVKFGYDTKDAMHLVRLLRSGHEILTKGTLTVRRTSTDAQDLLDIRHGKWSYDELMAYVLPLKDSLKKIYEEKTYVVREDADAVALSDLCADIHEIFWNNPRATCGHPAD